MVAKLFLASSLLSAAYAAPTSPGRHGRPGYGGHPAPSSYSGCYDFFVDVPIDYEYYNLRFPEFTVQAEATELALQFTSRTAGNPADAITGPFNASETYKISSRYCPPAKGSTKKHDGTLLLLSHGIGFDKSYWSFDYPKNDPKNYSFTYNANKAGFATLSYDRLGTGFSSKPDPYNTLQAQVELSLLTAITTLVREGKYDQKVPKPEKVVHVGHSWGSILSSAIITTRPELSDGAVLTGFSNVQQYMAGFIVSTAFHIAAFTDPARFSNLPTGYLTWGDKSYNQYSFLKFPYFDEGVLEQAEATKQPFTIGEFTTEQNIYPSVAAEFKGPVLLMAASNDLIFCGANCSHDFIDPPAKKSYPVADLTTYIQPNTGHGMNLHYNATGWYNYVFNYLTENNF